MRPEDFYAMSEKDRYIYITMYDFPEQAFLEVMTHDPIFIIGIMAGIYNIGQRPEYQAGA